MAENKTFEQKMEQLEKIVNQLEQGNVSLEESMHQFKIGVSLSEELSNTLTTAENTMTKMMDKSGKEVAFKNPKEDAKNGD